MSYQILWIVGILTATIPVFYWLINTTVGFATDKYTSFTLHRSFGIKNTQLPLNRSLIDNTVIIWAVIGALFGVILTWGSNSILLGAIICGFWAGVSVIGFREYHRRRTKSIRYQECLELFRLVETYMQLGMPLQLALVEAKEMLVVLKPAVNKTLAYWGMGSENALRVLQKEINLPEAESLVMLLSQVNNSGIKNFDNIIKMEADRLEDIREAAEQMQISIKPLILILYRVLPLLAILGMVAGVMFTRTMTILKDAGLM
jgi:hypothetical protein